MSKKNKNIDTKKTKVAVKNNAQQKPATAVENKKQADKPAKEEEKKVKQTKPVQDPPKNNVQPVEVKQEDDGITIITPEEVKETILPDDSIKGLQRALAHNNGSHLSSDGQVRLLDLARRAFVEENRTGFAVPTEVQQNMNYVINVGIVTKLAESAVNGDTAFDIVMKSAAYPRLLEVAKGLGVTLPSVKSIEAHTTKEDKKAGNVRIPAGKGSGTKVSPEATDQLKKDKDIQDNKPELDPTKITSEDDLKKALQYLLTIKNKSVGKTLVDVVDFMRNYRMTEASKANNSTEAMERLDERTTAGWLDDIFRYVTPSFLMGGIGKGMALTFDATGSPVRAFTILRESIKASDEKPEWCEQDIADAVSCIIRWVSQVSLKKDQKNLEALGDPKKYDKNTKAIAEKYNESIQKQQGRITNIMSPNGEFLSTFLDKFYKLDKNAVTLYGVIRRMYYSETLSEENKSKKYKNLDNLILNKVGYIFNLFRTSDSKIGEYSETDIESPICYTDEELEAMKQEELEVKKHLAKKK